MAMADEWPPSTLAEDPTCRVGLRGIEGRLEALKLTLYTVLHADIIVNSIIILVPILLLLQVIVSLCSLDWRRRDLYASGSNTEYWCESYPLQRDLSRHMQSQVLHLIPESPHPKG